MRIHGTVTTLIMALTLVGCGKAKSEAQQGAKDVDAACKKSKDEGSKLGQEWFGKNEVFKKAVEGAMGTWKVNDAKDFPYCGPAFIEAKSRIDNG